MPPIIVIGKVLFSSSFFGGLDKFYYFCSKKEILANMNDNNKEQQGLQLELPQEVAQGEYANFAIITHRVILAPEHAKRLLAAIQENIMRYEKEFGPIRIPNQQAAPIAPFDLTKGEA